LPQVKKVKKVFLTFPDAGHNDGEGAGEEPYEEGRLEDSTEDGASNSM
jgi:hypothetical protein